MSEKKQDMQENTEISNETIQTKFEQERYTRRQALRKFGFGAGLSAFLLLSVDDLARMVGRQLQQISGDNQVANQIAKEFRNAGVAFAGPSDPRCGTTCSTCEANIEAYGINECKDTYFYPGFCEQAVEDCINMCAPSCPSSGATKAQILAFNQCYDSCISGKGYPIASY